MRNENVYNKYSLGVYGRCRVLAVVNHGFDANEHCENLLGLKEIFFVNLRFRPEARK
jgi:hypothetical protein